MSGFSSSQFLSNCSSDTLAVAALRLKNGGLVAFPTETVYGLGADATNNEAVSRIYQVKGRPSEHPLIVHIASIDGLGIWARDIPEYAIALARDYWPGPMTLVLLRSEIAKDFITGGQDTVGLRVPAHALALGLLNEFAKLGGLGVAAPSANRFGQISPTTAQAVSEEIAEFLSATDLILDGGPALVGVESTIIDCTGLTPRILRPGAITEEMIFDSTGIAVSDQGDAIRVSGSLESHYSPRARVVLNAIPESGEGYIAFSTLTTPAGVERLASPSTIEEFARDLYSALRAGDVLGLPTIVVVAPEGGGLALAIRDRLLRASHEPN
ncbi:MAG: L-threonylcarbamoyladenylate synthase [Actinobacteria bacterium]|nr:L-threonylcarbamoyladenylate synthase [Actinomycetota bacterium]